MAQILMDPFGKVWEHPKDALCRYASYIFLHIRDHGDVKFWWNNYGDLYQGVTIAGRDVHGIEGSQHFYKQIPIKEETSDEESSEDDEEMNDADDEMSDEKSDEEHSYNDDEMSYETRDPESSDSYDVMADFNHYHEILDLTQDDD